jgi:hypothetical protein
MLSIVYGWDFKKTNLELEVEGYLYYGSSLLPISFVEEEEDFLLARFVGFQY